MDTKIHNTEINALQSSIAQHLSDFFETTTTPTHVLIITLFQRFLQTIHQQHSSGKETSQTTNLFLNKILPNLIVMLLSTSMDQKITQLQIQLNLEIVKLLIWVFNISPNGTFLSLLLPILIELLAAPNAILNQTALQIISHISQSQADGFAKAIETVAMEKKVILQKAFQESVEKEQMRQELLSKQGNKLQISNFDFD